MCENSFLFCGQPAAGFNWPIDMNVVWVEMRTNYLNNVHDRSFDDLLKSSDENIQCKGNTGIGDIFVSSVRARTNY